MTEVLYPRDPLLLQALGDAAADLLDLGRGPAWILRRKEKVTLLDDSVVRRQMSVDFSLPASVEPLATVDEKPVYYAPLFFLPKGLDEPFDPAIPPKAPEPLFANFDLRDETGRALSLPAREWNGLVTSELLRAFIDSVLSASGKSDPEAAAGIAAISREICTSDHHKAELWLEDLRSSEGLEDASLARRMVHEADAENPSLARMLEVCATSSVVMTPLITRDACHGIIKLSFDEQVTDISPRQRSRRPLAALGWAGYELWVETPYIGAASCSYSARCSSSASRAAGGLWPREPCLLLKL